MASAAPTPAATAPVAAYGSNGCTIGIAVHVHHAGDRFTVSGTCGILNDLLTFTVRSTPQVIGTTTANANGQYSVDLTLPTNLEPGTHTLTVTDADGTLDAVTTFEIVSGAASNSTSTGSGASSSSSSGSGGLAFTGTDVLGTTLVGAGAIGVGGLLVMSSRKRKRRNFRA